MMDESSLPRIILCSLANMTHLCFVGSYTFPWGQFVQLKPPSELWHIPLHLFGIEHSSISTPIRIIVVSYGGLKSKRLHLSLTNVMCDRLYLLVLQVDT